MQLNNICSLSYVRTSSKKYFFLLRLLNDEGHMCKLFESKVRAISAESAVSAQHKPSRLGPPISIPPLSSLVYIYYNRRRLFIGHAHHPLECVNHIDYIYKYCFSFFPPLEKPVLKTDFFHQLF